MRDSAVLLPGSQHSPSPDPECHGFGWKRMCVAEAISLDGLRSLRRLMVDIPEG